MKKIKILAFLILLIAVLSLIPGCVSFKGEIPAELKIDTIYISPENQDGIKDALSLTLYVPQIKGLKLQEYMVRIVSENKETVFLAEGKEEKKGLFSRKKAVIIPDDLTWDGRMADGSWAPDGSYQLYADVRDYRGNMGEYGPLSIIVDNTAPSAEISIPYSTFSPNMDDSQDVLEVFQRKTSSESLWTGIIKKEDEIIRSYSWNGLAAGSFTWDGRDNEGALLQNGTYSYILESTDEAGNSFRSKVEGIQIDNRTFPVRITFLDTPEFSPNGDGIKDFVRIGIETTEKDQIESLDFTVINSNGRIVANTSSVGTDTYVFTGRQNDEVFPEGFYFAILDVLYKNGDRQKAVSGRITLDVTPPFAVIKAGYNLFSPDGDGRKDETTIYQSSSSELSWTGSILSGSGVLRTWQWQERVLPVVWDGRDQLGNTVADGIYVYRVESTDIAGNSASFQSAGVRVDTSQTPVHISPIQSVFSPNMDGDNDFIAFNLKPEVTEGIVGWEVYIRDNIGQDVYMFSNPNTAEVPGTLYWNGRNFDGVVKEGEYSAVLQTEYEKGNLGFSETETYFKIDNSPPEVKISVSPLPFSPDGDGVNDRLNIGIILNDPSGIRSWSGRILDPAGNLFLAFDSKSLKNGILEWDGRDKKGELVQSASDYLVEVSAVDSVGNQSVVSKTAPVDILVFKDGERLRISISSIYFKPFTADYINIDQDLKNRNLATLDRLAEILKKYSVYKIRLEGHAVRVYWNDAKKWKTEEDEVLLPLSQERAERILDALVGRGIKQERMSAVGYGGYQPVVPHSDEINRWKNRRVEFILVK